MDISDDSRYRGDDILDHDMHSVLADDDNDAFNFGLH